MKRAALLLSLVALIGCGEDPVAPTPIVLPSPIPTCVVTVTVNGNGDTTVNGCGNTTIITNPSPSPGAGQGGLIDGVDIAGIVGGEHCTTGTPANLSKTVGVGCYLDGTINPYRKVGEQKQVIFDEAITGTSPERFERHDSFAGATVTQDGTNPFNWRLTCTSAGTVVLSATVKGVSSGDVAFACK